jgi:hypothetical protein
LDCLIGWVKQEGEVVNEGNNLKAALFSSCLFEWFVVNFLFLRSKATLINMTLICPEWALDETSSPIVHLRKWGLSWRNKISWLPFS